MDSEIEAKFLNIDKVDLRAKLQKAGAELSHQDRLMRRVEYDYPDKRLEKIGGWIRVRDEGDKTTFCYKQLNDRTLHGTKEVGVIVSDYNQVCQILDNIGLVPCAYRETKRESWRLDDTEIEIDEWPWIPPFVEIEAKDEQSLKNTAMVLDLKWNEAMHGSVETAYQAVYDVSEQQIDDIEDITFTDVPDWLEKTRK